MKKTAFMIAVLAVLVACGGGGEKKEETKKEETPATNDITTNPDYQKGVEIVSQSDCFTCHKIDEKNIGPAWRDVAKKYAGQDTAVRYLAHKIINGGSGVWGQVPMTPHDGLPEDEAKAMVKYVLSLKNAK